MNNDNDVEPLDFCLILCPRDLLLASPEFRDFFLHHEVREINVSQKFHVIRYFSLSHLIPALGDTLIHTHCQRRREFIRVTLADCSKSTSGVGCPGGALGYFLGGYVPPGIPNWHPVLEKNSPKIDTPF